VAYQNESAVSVSRDATVTQTRTVNPTSLESLRRVINFEEAEDNLEPASGKVKENRTPGVDSTSNALGVLSLDYAYVSQHHSVSYYPPCWSHPVQLLLQFCNSKAFLSHFNGLRKSDTLTVGAESTCNRSSLVMLPLPTAMPLRCPAPHLHRWNPSPSDDVCGYFHDKVKVVAIKGTIYRYRCFRLKEHRMFLIHLYSWEC
jgi:hypothetical protein